MLQPGGGVQAQPVPSPARLAINEVDYDQRSSDTAEFVELFNAGGAPIELAGHVLEFVDGSAGGGGVYGRVALPLRTLDPGAFFVVCAEGRPVPRCDLAVATEGDLLQNGAPDAVRLVREGVLIDAVAYGGRVAGATEGHGTRFEDLALGDFALARVPDGADTDRNDVDLSLQTPTPGAPNLESAQERFAHEVQGLGSRSRLLGALVQVEAVVVADFRGPDALGGFYVQEEDADTDADARTSEGLFVAANWPDVRPGDRVRLSANVAESYGVTTLANVSRFELVASGAPLPTATAVRLPVADVDDLEAFEGMRVAFPQTLTVTETYNLARYGEIALATGRLPAPTEVALPGTAARAQAAANASARILLDDASTRENPLPVPWGLGADATIRGGDTVTGLEGILTFGFDVYRVQPTGPVAFVAANPRPLRPPAVRGDLRVVGFNVLNYFTTVDTGAPRCGPTGGMDCRGADSAEELARQRAKVLATLVALAPDVAALQELQNDDGATLRDLVAGLDAAFGAGAYAAVHTDPIGSDAIAVGLLYRTDTVRPVGAYAVLDASVDPEFIDTKNRPVLAQTFEALASSERFTVASVHLKSKGSGCDDVGDRDARDGQGACNGTRTRASEAIARWLASDPTGSGDPDALLLGDLNAYRREDPVRALENAGFVDLIGRDAGADGYTYVFMGEWGALDHALATPALAARAHAAVWHVNADEPRALDASTEWNPPELYAPSPVRASDHDPLVVGLQWGPVR